MPKTCKIAVAGKGGTGKTTIAGTLARCISQRGHRVWAIDADSNPNLALTLGVPREDVGSLPALPSSVLEAYHDDSGKRRRRLSKPAAQIAEQHGVTTPGDIQLMLMGTVGHAGAG